MKSSDETGSAIVSPVRSAEIQSNQQSTRSNLSSARIRLTSCKNTAFLKLRPTQSSTKNIAVLPGINMLDKAKCDHHSVSHLPFPMVVRKEGEREKSPNEPDFTAMARPVAQTNSLL